jgi:hypothetical protein
MAQRSKLSRGGQRRLFKATKGSHRLNRPRPLRGGTRL